jgi:hypothetical protein
MRRRWRWRRRRWRKRRRRGKCGVCVGSAH